MNRSQKFSAVLCLSVALCLCLSGCGSRQSNAAPVTTQAARATPTPRSTTLARSEPPNSDESEAEDDDNNGDDDSDTNAEDFHGYRCTVDCSGHEAGYRWAEQHDIHDPDDCGGKSQSFIEGCQAWAEENP